MSPEVTEAPIDHMKITDVIQKTVILKFYELEAYEEKNAVVEEALRLEGMEPYAFKKLVEEGAITKTEIEEEELYYLSEEFKPVKNYRKQVVMGLSIPILIFLVAIITAGFGAIIYQIVRAFI